MKKLFTFFLIVFSAIPFTYAQIKYVNYNVVSNELNERNPVPSEEPFYIQGRIPTNVEYVKVKVYRSGRNPSQGFEYTWKVPFDFPVSNYELFIADPLRSNERYDFEFSYYQKAEIDQMETVREAINNNLESYIRSSMEISRRGIRSVKSDQVMINEMNAILNSGLDDYRHFLGREFSGFSDVVRQKLAQKNRMRLNRARFNILRRNPEDNERAVYALQYVDELVATVQQEADQYLTRSLMALVDIRTVQGYPTEDKPSTLPLNFGYGAFAIQQSLPNTEYFNGPYVGLSLPLGNRVFQKVLGNASFSTGVFLQNFNSSQGDRITGPLIGLPIYAGLGYKIFRIFRLNAGAVLVNFEDAVTSNTTNYIQPYAGISLELNLWLGLNNRR
ncbi:MAG TPA: hypothetical protein VK921_10775 [Anditalea sp.]|nr:hypothetical protein [Anditalea sp.]